MGKLKLVNKIYRTAQGVFITIYTICMGCMGIGAFSVEGVSAEPIQQRVKPYYQEKVAAAQLALEAMTFLKKERLKRGLEIDTEVDPARSGLIGSRMTPVTSEAGDLEAKQASINPNFAALVVELLKQVKVQEGDGVAISLTGSFPALNLCVGAAIQTLKLKPVIISTASASQWGANEPNFLWIDMERLLYENNIFRFRSVAASIGGKNDRGEEMSPEGRDLLIQAIKRNGLPWIRSATLRENVEQRMKIYYERTSPKAFVNVGGGVVSVGKRSDRRLLQPGIVFPGTQIIEQTDSVIYQFLEADRPVIHLEDVKELARLYGLALHPVRMPAIGEGSIYIQNEE